MRVATAPPARGAHLCIAALLWAWCAGTHTARAQGQPSALDVERLRLASDALESGVDWTGVVAVTKGWLTVAGEVTCAARSVGESITTDGSRVAPVLFAVGCGLGATTMSVLTLRSTLALAENGPAAWTLALNRALMQGVTTQEHQRLRRDLRDLASSSRTRRVVYVVAGLLEWAVAATITTLRFTGTLDEDPYNAIAVSFGALGALSVPLWFSRSPAEQAWLAYQR